MESFKHDLLTEKIIGCCHDVHKLLGPVFIENIYAKALQYQLKILNLNFEHGKEFNVVLKTSLLVSSDVTST